MRVVVVDDHPLVAAGLRAVFAQEDSIALIGEASTPDEGFDLIVNSQPDIALIDLKLGNDSSGLTLIRRCKEEQKRREERDCKYVILTSSTDYIDFQMALAQGVDGYALKEALPEELVYIVRIVAKGRKYFDPLLLEESQISTDDDLLQPLTSKELEVLRALGRGLNNHEIAAEMFISEFTVKKHVSQILAKLNVADRTQAALWANQRGLATYEVNHGR